MQHTPDDLNGFERFLTLGRIVTPRPVGWISTIDEHGEPNLAPYSFVTPATVDPPTIMLAVAPHRSGEPKDTAVNVLETEAFVYNLFTEPMLAAMNETARDIDGSEFAAAGIDAADCETVDVPRVAAAPAWIECTLRKAHSIGDNHIVYGDVELIGVEDSFADGSLPDPAAIEDRVMGHIIDRHYTTIDLVEHAQPE